MTDKEFDAALKRMSLLDIDALMEDRQQTRDLLRRCLAPVGQWEYVECFGKRPDCKCVVCTMLTLLADLRAHLGEERQ